MLYLEESAEPGIGQKCLFGQKGGVHAEVTFRRAKAILADLLPKDLPGPAIVQFNRSALMVL
jgi:hypothetical protein